MAERSWPTRFRVTIQTNGGTSASYSAVTWLSQEKAVAIAVLAHVRRYGSEPEPMSMNDVDVVELGPVDQGADQAMRLEKTDLFDRMEF